MTKTTCSKCESQLTPNRIAAKQKYCNPCHAENMRLNRPKHSELPELARKKANARSYANVYKRHGRIEEKPCIECGADKAEMHHEDYSKPTEVIFLCRPCHLNEHKVNLTSVPRA